MKSFGIVILYLWIILTVLSCENNKEETIEPSTLTACYEETALADPWYNPLNEHLSETKKDSFLIADVKRFLLKDSISTYSVIITTDGIRDPCCAGFCTTGRRIKALIDTKNLIKIQKKGFDECQ